VAVRSRTAALLTTLVHLFTGSGELSSAVFGLFMFVLLAMYLIF